MMKKTQQTVQWAESLAKLVRESGASELRLEHGARSLRIRRNSDLPIRSEAASPSPLARSVSESVEDFGTPVKSNYVGIFRAKHPKTEKLMISAQDTCETNQVLGWVECMGNRYEVVAPRAGTVAEVLVNDAEPLEFGQVLMVIQ